MNKENERKRVGIYSCLGPLSTKIIFTKIIFKNDFRKLIHLNDVTYESIRPHTAQKSSLRPLSKSYLRIIK